MVEATRNDSVSVGTTAVEIAPRRQDRKTIYIRNNSTAAQVITLVFSDAQNAVAGSGGMVLAAGDYIVDSNSAEYICWQGKISAVASAASGSITVYER